MQLLHDGIAKTHFLETIVQEFLVILEDYVARTYPPATSGELAGV